MKSFPMFAGLLLLAAIATPAIAAEPSDNIGAVLRQTVSLEFDNLTLDQCAERLRALTKLNVAIHPSLRPLLEAREQQLLFGDNNPAGAPPPEVGGDPSR